MAMTDALTGLANRTLLGERIREALQPGAPAGCRRRW
jgi:GGDEF domain-containing protein